MLKHNTGACLVAERPPRRPAAPRIGSACRALRCANFPNSEQQLERELKIARPTGAEDRVKSGASPGTTSQ